MSINGAIVAQTSGDDIWMLDEDVVRLVRGTIGTKRKEKENAQRKC